MTKAASLLPRPSRGASARAGALSSARRARSWAVLRSVAAPGLVVLLQACARAPEPALPAALPPPAIASVTRALPVPARIGLLRIAEGRITAIPADELGRWRGALREVNRGLLYPIRAVPMAPAETADAAAGALADAIAAAVTGAAVAGLDAVLAYELSVAVPGNPGAAALSALPLVGGIVPVAAMARARGQGRALLIEAQGGAVIGRAAARMDDAAIAPAVAEGGSGAALRPLAEYAMLNLLAPRVEDMLTAAVGNGR